MAYQLRLSAPFHRYTSASSPRRGILSATGGIATRENLTRPKIVRPRTNRTAGLVVVGTDGCDIVAVRVTWPKGSARLGLAR